MASLQRVPKEAIAGVSWVALWVQRRARMAMQQLARTGSSTAASMEECVVVQTAGCKVGEVVAWTEDREAV